MPGQGEAVFKASGAPGLGSLTVRRSSDSKNDPTGTRQRPPTMVFAHMPRPERACSSAVSRRVLKTSRLRPPCCVSNPQVMVTGVRLPSGVGTKMGACPPGKSSSGASDPALSGGTVARPVVLRAFMAALTCAKLGVIMWWHTAGLLSAARSGRTQYR